MDALGASARRQPAWTGFRKHDVQCHPQFIMQPCHDAPTFSPVRREPDDARESPTCPCASSAADRALRACPRYAEAEERLLPARRV